MGTSGATASTSAPSAVVLANGLGGDELTAVRAGLTGSLGTPTVLLQQADLLSTPISLDLGTGILSVNGCQVSPVLVWARHCAAGTIAAHAKPAGSISLLAAATWSEFVSHLSRSTATALPGSAPATTMQLREAARLGVTTPRTVITTDVESAARAMRTRRVVIKTPDFRLYQPDSRTWDTCLPQVVERDSVPAGQAYHGRPVVVQEYVAHARELRVYYLNGGICAFAVGKREPSVMWSDPDSVAVTRADCPPAVAEIVRLLCAEWGLRYGAFDLLLPERGEPVFLEVNADGDWLWYERKARWHGVTFMAAVMVRDLFVKVTS